MAKNLAFTVPPCDDSLFLLETYDGSVYQIEIPEHVTIGHRLHCQLEEDMIMLKYFHLEGDVGLPSGGDEPKLAIGRRADETAQGPLVFAEMNKHISFQFASDQECIVQLDDGRCFNVSIPDHVAVGQALIAAVDGTDLLLAYFHNEGEFRAVNETQQLVIGSQVDSKESSAPRVLAETVPPHHHK